MRIASVFKTIVLPVFVSATVMMGGIGVAQSATAPQTSVDSAAGANVSNQGMNLAAQTHRTDAGTPDVDGDYARLNTENVSVDSATSNGVRGSDQGMVDTSGAATTHGADDPNAGRDLTDGNVSVDSALPDQAGSDQGMSTQ